MMQQIKNLGIILYRNVVHLCGSKLYLLVVTETEVGDIPEGTRLI